MKWDNKLRIDFHEKGCAYIPLKKQRAKLNVLTLYQKYSQPRVLLYPMACSGGSIQSMLFFLLWGPDEGRHRSLFHQLVLPVLNVTQQMNIILLKMQKLKRRGGNNKTNKPTNKYNNVKLNTILNTMEPTNFFSPKNAYPEYSRCPASLLQPLLLHLCCFHDDLHVP